MRLGARPNTLSPQNSAQRRRIRRCRDFELERFLHLYALNRGVLLTPSTTWPSCPRTTEADIDATQSLRRRRARTYGLVSAFSLLEA